MNHARHLRRPENGSEKLCTVESLDSQTCFKNLYSEISHFSKLKVISLPLNLFRCFFAHGTPQPILAGRFLSTFLSKRNRDFSE